MQRMEPSEIAESSRNVTIPVEALWRQGMQLETFIQENNLQAGSQFKVVVKNLPNRPWWKRILGRP